MCVFYVKGPYSHPLPLDPLEMDQLHKHTRAKLEHTIHTEKMKFKFGSEVLNRVKLFDVFPEERDTIGESSAAC